MGRNHHILKPMITNRNGIPPFRSYFLAAHVVAPHWPSGSYALPRPKTGCPGAHWREGFRYQDSENVQNTNLQSNNSHLSGVVNRHGIKQEFCIHVASTRTEEAFWPPGKYCIYKKGESCPNGLQEGLFNSLDFSVLLTIL